MKPPKTLAILISAAGIVACFQKRETLWESLPVDGEASVSLALCGGLPGLLDKLNTHFNRSDRLAEFVVHIICDHPAMAFLKKLPETLERLHCDRWQLLRREPLQERAAILYGAPPHADEKQEKWLIKYFLPLLDSLFNAETEGLSHERALHAEAMKALESEQKTQEETLESLTAQKQAMQNEIALLRSQQANIEQLIACLPGICRNFFMSVSPADLALLAGKLEIPAISSPFPDPAGDTLLVLQRKIRRLPEREAEIIRTFIRQLPHKLDIRAEMRDWLGELS